MMVAMTTTVTHTVAAKAASVSTRLTPAMGPRAASSRATSSSRNFTGVRVPNKNVLPVVRGGAGGVGVCRAASSSPSPSSDEDFVPWTSPSRLALAAGWVALGSAAAFVAPKGTEAFDMELITTLVSAPFSGAVNPLFEALFNSLGVVPTVYAALLLPGAKDQPRLPAAPPIVASFALGFFALGPYLILREPREAPVAKSSLGWAARTVFESKPFALFNAAFAVFLAGYAATHVSPEAVSGFATLWTEQSALCCVSSCDLLVLSLAMYSAMSEDMKRRGVFEPAKCAAFCALPVVGPTLWLVTRPPLED